jgi:spore coat polysaccharide biosynthesis protein SpsF
MALGPFEGGIRSLTTISMTAPVSPIEVLVIRSPVAIVQARMTSTRLPGKVLMPIRGRPMLAWQLDRLGHIREDVRLAVATTTNQSDDRVVALCETMQIPVIRGSEGDVLDRYRTAASLLGADPIIRITSDCPLIDPDVTRQVLELWETERVDYASNTIERTFPQGLDTEVLSAAALDSAWHGATERFEREHVTPYIYLRPDRFRLANLVGATDESRHRWTVDTPEDLAFVRAVYHALAADRPDFRTADVLALIAERPALGLINRGVTQKPLRE